MTEREHDERDRLLDEAYRLLNDIYLDSDAWRAQRTTWVRRVARFYMDEAGVER